MMADVGQQHVAYTRLEPDDGKPSSPVLRGGSGSDAASLPDRNALPKSIHALRARPRKTSLLRGSSHLVCQSDDCNVAMSASG
jgi:hypothetical protein